MSDYYFKCSGLSFEKDDSDRDKFVVLACAKNEGDYLREWVGYYLSLGFDKVFIADNNDVGDDSHINALADYVSNGQVQIFDCRGVEALQVGLYSDFCAESNFKWCAFYDCDEFLEIAPYKNVKDWIKQFENYDVVLLNWLIFGPNGQIKKEDGTIQERFTKPFSPVLYFKDNGYVKSLVQGNREKFEGCFFTGSHRPVPAEGKTLSVTVAGEYEPKSTSQYYLPLRYKNGYIKHYYTKSFEEWIMKASRGWPDGTNTLTASKYLIFENEGMLPSIEFMKRSIFREDKGCGSFEEVLNTYDVILINDFPGSPEFTYQKFGMLMGMFSSVKDHTFMFCGDNIDNVLYTILLEYAYVSGNRAVFCKNQEEVWMTYCNYGKISNTYYIISC